MSWIAWIVVGLIAGYLAKMLMPGRQGGGLLITLVVGVIGAVVGGWVFGAFGGAPATGINFYSIVVATVGAIVFLWVLGLLTRARTA
ncbi:MAG: GlsB/YeaQ/YmgE family stress response membrane protein [bacterium]